MPSPLYSWHKTGRKICLVFGWCLIFITSGLLADPVQHSHPYPRTRSIGQIEVTPMAMLDLSPIGRVFYDRLENLSYCKMKGVSGSIAQEVKLEFAIGETGKVTSHKVLGAGPLISANGINCIEKDLALMVFHESVRNRKVRMKLNFFSDDYVDPPVEIRPPGAWRKK